MMLLRWSRLLLLAAGFLVLGTVTASAQQRIAYIDSEYILDNTPEYATVQQKIDQLEQQWREELKEQQDTIDALYREYESRELLYTEEEREQKRQELVQAEQEMENLRQRYFGPDGELYQRQQELMRPLQERILEAVEEIATDEGYDYVFDRSGEFLFMFTRDQYDLSDQVLRELGIDVNNENNESREP